MRILIAGAGAIGGYLGACLARAADPAVDLVLFARGAHLQAMEQRGLRVISPDGDFEVRPRVTGDLGSVGQVDVIFLGVKAHGLTALAPQLRPLFGPNTIVVSLQNGIPWWYFQGIGGEFDGFHLERVDPGGVIAAAIEPARVVGSLAYFATDIVEPGVIRHTEGNKISFGEPDGSKSDRVRAIAAPLIAAGFRCPINARFRHEVWVKLLGNVAFNPISALTGATLEELVRHPEVSRAIRDIMAETEALAAKFGIELPVSIDQRMAGARKSAPQDLDAQDLEADARWSWKRWSGPSSNSATCWASRCRRRRRCTRARSCWRRGVGRPHAGGGHRDDQQPVVPARGVAHRHDHDREPAVRLDAVREADAAGDGMEAVGYPVGVHVVRAVSNVGAAGARISDRSSGTAAVRDHCRRPLRRRLGGSGSRAFAADACTRSTCWPASARRWSTAGAWDRR